MMWGYYNNNAGMMVWTIIMSLFWLGLLAVAVWALLRWLNRTTKAPTPTQGQVNPSALDVLNLRYAHGEIDADTYRSMRAELEASGSSAQRTRETVPIGR
jgi:putative membrane protein